MKNVKKKISTVVSLAFVMLFSALTFADGEPAAGANPATVREALAKYLGYEIAMV